MTAVIASAPGKVVLCGEYAVLDGAPAVAMAVDRRAQVTVTPCDGGCHRVSAPGHTPVEGRFVAGANGVEWLQGGELFGVVDAVWRSLGIVVNGHRSIELDTRAFVDAATGAKVGIGSSAALTVALAAALRESTDVLDDALAAHRDFQQGSGSGVDVAAAVSGGLLEYRMEGPALTALTWPDGLAYRLIWSGVPVSTRDKLSRLQDSDRRASRAELVVAAERMAGAWRSASAGAVLDEYCAYVEVLRAFGVDHDLGIIRCWPWPHSRCGSRRGFDLQTVRRGRRRRRHIAGSARGAARRFHDERAGAGFAAARLQPGCRRNKGGAGLKDSRISGLYRLGVAERIDALQRAGWLSADDADDLRNGRQVLASRAADKIIENVVGVFGLPFAIAPNFVVNGHERLVPLVVEEPSIVCSPERRRAAGSR